MDYLFPLTAIFGIWAFLSLLGSERERRARQLDYQIARAAAQRALDQQLAAEAAARQTRANAAGTQSDH